MAQDQAKQIRAALYARVSTEEQKEGQTIDSQIAELERFASERGYMVSAVYKDDGWSGGVLARPQLDLLRDHAAAGAFDAVLINDVDRLARDVTHLGIIKRDLERKGIQLIFRKLPAENSPTHNLMINVLGSFAEFEREMIADRTRRGRLHKIEVRGKYLGSITSYGYRYIPAAQSATKEGALEIEPAEAAVVRQMFELVDREGLSAHRVVERLNRLKIRARKGSRWAKSSVLKVLHNEMYVGVWYYNKLQSFEPEHGHNQQTYRRRIKSAMRLRDRAEWIPLQLPTSLHIVDRDQWKRVQDQLRRNIAFSPRHEKHSYLLKGLVSCAACGSRYVGEPSHGRFSYRCAARCKRCPLVSERILDQAVWDEVERAILDPELIADQITKLNQQDEKASSDLSAELRDTANELAQLEKEESRLMKAYRLSVITPAQLGSELEKLGTRKRSLQARDDQLANNRPAAEPDVRRSVASYCQQAAETLHQFTPGERQQFLRTLIKAIVFDGAEARIRAEIPQDHGLKWPDRSNGNLESHAPGRIASKDVQQHGRNPSVPLTFSLIARLPLPRH
ncbi:MAG: recombinase family protein [Acidobacteriaceae bacterium]|nr:recombinase family protein [Acidobacteriaceae bacterium]